MSVERAESRIPVHVAPSILRVYGPTATLKDVLASINYQLDKYENLMFSHHLDDAKNRLTGAIASTINDIKERK
jgi:hypothetical protein